MILKEDERRLKSVFSRSILVLLISFLILSFAIPAQAFNLSNWYCCLKHPLGFELEYVNGYVVAQQIRVEGAHIAVVGDDIGLVKDQVSWLSKLDIAYDSMVELTAGEPVVQAASDKKITILEDPSVHGAAYAGNPIRIDPAFFRSQIEGSWNAYGDPSFAFIHEMGHDFHWDFPGFHFNEGGGATNEAFANFILIYAYEKLNPENIVLDRVYDGVADLETNFYLTRANTYLSGERSFEKIKWNNDAFTGLLILLKNKYGWGIFQKAFAMHRNLLGTSQISYQSLDQFTDIKKVNLFVFMLSEAAGEDLSPQFEEWGFRIVPTSTILTTSLNPSSIAANTYSNLTITGRLSRVDTGLGLEGRIVSFSCFNGTIGSTVTDENGSYTFKWTNVSLANGSYTVTASFTGDSLHEPSSKAQTVSVIEKPPPPSLPTVPGFPPEAVLIGITLAVGAIVFMRKKTRLPELWSV